MSAWCKPTGEGRRGTTLRAFRALCAVLLAAGAGWAAELHWSFAPVRRPDPPPGNPPASGFVNPIDAFVARRLAENGLAPSPPADRRTLVRRAYFDLIGLPPSPEESDAFVADGRPDAYERLVERLLASPHFGERWARHWLDVVRFAETHGFEMNTPRATAWPYRDYVIRAFNSDKPYDAFVLEQIAGDALGADDATGFLVAGPWDQVKSPDETLTKNQRADELHDIINTTGTAFLGLTLGCARCHDHKFDPIPQRDYYAIKAVFEGVRHGERARREPEDLKRLAAAERMRERVGGIDAALVAFEPPAQTAEPIDTNRLRAPVHPRLNSERFPPRRAKRVRFTILATTDGSEPCIDELEVFAAGDSGRNLALASAGTTASASGTYSGSDYHKLEHLNDGRTGNRRSWISNEGGKGWVELELAAEATIDRVVWGRDRDEEFKDRLPSDYRIETADAAGVWTLAASSADRRPYKAGEPYQPDYATNRLAPAALAHLRGLLHDLDEARTELKRLEARRMIYAGDFAEPEPTHRFNRGDPMQPREEVAPGALSFPALHAESVCLASDTPERSRRLALGRWIASTNNPLTARVIVNRLWQGYFGDGLVGTPSDFGKNGARPSNPELLDWLAAELMHPTAGADASSSPPWSLKHIHRLIATSAAYRQGSDSRAEAQKIDGGDRFLWRYPPRRLEAEPLRDSILAVAGKLDLRMGGPGWSPFVPNENYVRVYKAKETFNPLDFRRMVYATVVRQRPEGVFGVFDCPDAGQIAPRRTRSITPLQALNLFNSGFMGQAAGFFAERLEREAGPRPQPQVVRAFALACQRPPTAEELAQAVAFVREEGLRPFCRALLNANEFVYVF